MSEPSLDGVSEIVIAKWSDRFCAWLIDFCIISIISILMISSVFGTINYELSEKLVLAETTQFIPTSMLVSHTCLLFLNSEFFFLLFDLFYIPKLSNMQKR